MKIEYRMPNHCANHNWEDTFCGVPDIEECKKIAKRWLDGAFTSEPPSEVRVLSDNGKLVLRMAAFVLEREEPSYLVFYDASLKQKLINAKE